jgi:hypothetical protein
MPTSLPALGICLEEYEYPYPVQFLPITSDLQSLKMAYMDIPPDNGSYSPSVSLMIEACPLQEGSGPCPSPIVRGRRPGL